VETINKKNDVFTFKTGDGNNYQSKAVVLALGFYDTPRELDVPGKHLTKVKHYYGDAHQYIGMNLPWQCETTNSIKELNTGFYPT